MKPQISEPKVSVSSPRKKLSFAALGTVGASLLFHFGLLLLVGSAVIIQGVFPKTNFVADTPVETVQDEIAPSPDEPVNSPDTPTDTAATDSVLPPVPDAASAPYLITTETVIPFQTMSMTNTFANATTSGLGTNGSQAVAGGGAGKAGVLRNMTSLFGSKGQEQGALTGYLYDLKQEPSQKPTSMSGPKDETGSSNNPANQEYRKVLGSFLKIWNAGILEKYYKAPGAMSTYQVFLPKMQADEAPKAFDVDKYVKPRRWVILYKGSVTAPISTSFRFVGIADDILVVRFDRKIVLDGSLGKVSDWGNDRKETVGTVSRGNQTPLYAGDWVKIEAGKTYPVEILIGEQPGGVFYSLLYVQEKDKMYQPRPNNNGLILPLFQTAPTKIPLSSPENDAPTTKEGFVFGNAE